MDERIKQAVISALRYQFDGVDGNEQEHQLNTEIADKLEKGQLQIYEAVVFDSYSALTKLRLDVKLQKR